MSGGHARRRAQAQPPVGCSEAVIRPPKSTPRRKLVASKKIMVRTSARAAELSKTGGVGRLRPPTPPPTGRERGVRLVGVLTVLDSGLSGQIPYQEVDRGQQ